MFWYHGHPHMPHIPLPSLHRNLDILHSVLSEIESSDPKRNREQEPTFSYTESSNGGTLEVELPGVKPEHISVAVDGNKLVVTGKRYALHVQQKDHDRELKEEGMKTDEDEEEVEEEPMVIYKLKANLGTHANVAQVTAENGGFGVLVLKVPFKSAAPRRITIS